MSRTSIVKARRMAAEIDHTVVEIVRMVEAETADVVAIVAVAEDVRAVVVEDADAVVAAVVVDIAAAGMAATVVVAAGTKTFHHGLARIKTQGLR
jgi:hypothetical protein